MANVSAEFKAIESPIYLERQNTTLWDTFLDIVGDDPGKALTWGTTLLVFIVYWTHAGFFLLIDLTNRPHWLMKYKIQPTHNQPVDKKKLWKALLLVIFNILVITPFYMYTLHKTVFSSWTSKTIRQLPTLSTFLLDFGLYLLLEEPLLYYGHRFLHHRSIYKYIHKRHHEWKAPIAAVTFYCHPMEYIITNIGPISISAFVTQAHILVTAAFATVAILNSMTDHTGYSLPFPFFKAGVVFHDYHHAKSNYNFGAFGWLDKFHGTYRESSMGWKATNTKRLE